MSQRHARRLTFENECIRGSVGISNTRKRLITDGPFAETKEQLLGFVMIEAADIDETLEIAGGIPLAEIGTIEVRAI
ncbi:MAG: hypothetical protein EOR84_13810 [Mesorhizobium sp.]|nr:MAG: hypothetical protein EOR84_13810 [Mesorhizobium sp.]